MQHLEFRVEGLDLKVECVGPTRTLHRAWGLRFEVEDTGCRV